MNESQNQAGTEPSPSDKMSALFAQLILQQSNMAMMLLGKVAHPGSGEVVRDLESAQLFIDQLEMLELKTKGNLTKEESNLLKQSLMSLRLAFVEAAEEPAPAASKSTTQKPEGTASQEPGTEPSTPGTAPVAEEEHRKKFSKKY